jgi:hypothetical protein
VRGNINARVGVVTIGSDSIISGNIIGGAGAVSTGVNVKLNGTCNEGLDGYIKTTAGVVTIGANNRVGDITTEAGGITIGTKSKVGKLASPVGVITLGGDIEAISISSGGGAVTVGGNSHICGDINIIGAGVATLTTGIKVRGNISAITGGVTVGNGSLIQGHIKITGAGVVSLTSTSVGGEIATATGAITATNSNIVGTITSSNAAVITLTNVTKNAIDTSDFCTHETTSPAYCESYRTGTVVPVLPVPPLTCDQDTDTVPDTEIASCAALETRYDTLLEKIRALDEKRLDLVNRLENGIGARASELNCQ